MRPKNLNVTNTSTFCSVTKFSRTGSDNFLVANFYIIDSETFLDPIFSSTLVPRLFSVPNMFNIETIKQIDKSRTWDETETQTNVNGSGDNDNGSNKALGSNNNRIGSNDRGVGQMLTKADGGGRGGPGTPDFG